MGEILTIDDFERLREADRLLTLIEMPDIELLLIVGGIGITIQSILTGSYLQMVYSYYRRRSSDPLIARLGIGWITIVTVLTLIVSNLMQIMAVWYYEQYTACVFIDFWLNQFLTLLYGTVSAPILLFFVRRAYHIWDRNRWVLWAGYALVALTAILTILSSAFCLQAPWGLHLQTNESFAEWVDEFQRNLQFFWPFQLANATAQVIASGALCVLICYGIRRHRNGFKAFDTAISKIVFLSGESLLPLFIMTSVALSVLALPPVPATLGFRAVIYVQPAVFAHALLTALVSRERVREILQAEPVRHLATLRADTPPSDTGPSIPPHHQFRVTDTDIEKGGGDLDEVHPHPEVSHSSSNGSGSGSGSGNGNGNGSRRLHVKMADLFSSSGSGSGSGSSSRYSPHSDLVPRLRNARPVIGKASGDSDQLSAVQAILRSDPGSGLGTDTLRSTSPGRGTISTTLSHLGSTIPLSPASPYVAYPSSPTSPSSPVPPTLLSTSQQPTTLILTSLDRNDTSQTQRHQHSLFPPSPTSPTVPSSSSPRTPSADPLIRDGAIVRPPRSPSGSEYRSLPWTGTGSESEEKPSIDHIESPTPNRRTFSPNTKAALALVADWRTEESNIKRAVQREMARGRGDRPDHACKSAGDVPDPGPVLDVEKRTGTEERGRSWSLMHNAQDSRYGSEARVLEKGVEQDGRDPKSQDNAGGGAGAGADAGAGAEEEDGMGIYEILFRGPPEVATRRR